VLEVAIIALRWLQYVGAAVLLGAPLFLLYSVKGAQGLTLGWSRSLLIVVTAVVALGALAALVVQTAVMAGSLSEALKPSTLRFMVNGTTLGMAMAVRAIIALIAFVAVAALKAGRLSWGVSVAAGLVIAASFAWTGHGAATEGPGAPYHLTADIIHTVAAALWLGALAVLTVLLVRRTRSDDLAIHGALHGFSGLGTLAVALLVLTGLVNSWFLVGPAHVADLGASLYGRLLIVKLVLFVLMLAMAAANRFRLTPMLGSVLASGEDPRRAVSILRRSVIVETLVGAVLLAVVAVMGTLAPPSAM